MLQELSGHTVYLRLCKTPAPIPTSLDKLVGEGKLISYPNDVVAGPGSSWTHASASKHRFSTFGHDTTSSRIGHNRSAKCVLMLAVEWAWDNRDALAGCGYAEIGYKIDHEGHIFAVYAGKFMFKKKPYPLSFDRDKLHRYEFLCCGREVLSRPR